MLMQEIGIGDEITVEIDDDRAFGIEIDSDVDIEPEKDLGYKAAKAFYDAYDKKLRAEGRLAEEFPFTKIREVKKTPSQAGLGGGSSDAAAVLMILQQHFGNPLSEEALVEVSSRLGADVPFFLKGGTCICEGIGEIVTELPELSGLNLILVKPSVGVGTKECYELSDKSPACFDEEGYKERINEIFGDEKKSPLERIKAALPELTNDLQEPAIKIAPVIADLIEAVAETGSVYTAMTGSGSCVFGIFKDEQSCEKAVEKLKNNPVTAECLIISSVTI